MDTLPIHLLHSISTRLPLILLGVDSIGCKKDQNLNLDVCKDQNLDHGVCKDKNWDHDVCKKDKNLDHDACKDMDLDRNACRSVAAKAR